MTIQHSQVRDLGQLLTDVSTQGIAHIEIVQAYLTQICMPLAKAIDRLLPGFDALHEAVCAQDDAAQALQQDAGADRAQLHNTGAAIERQMQAMVTALQFEVMTSQIIAHAGQRTAGLSEILTGVSNGAQAIVLGDLAQLGNLRTALAAQSRDLNGHLMRSVDQRHIESGGTTMF